MDYKEAIERLKCMRLFMQINDKSSENKFLDEDYSANNMAISALEKQIQKKPEKKPDRYCDFIQRYYCPSCGRYFGQRGIHNVILFNKERYCQGENCGQAIDWSE